MRVRNLLDSNQDSIVNLSIVGSQWRTIPSLSSCSCSRSCYCLFFSSYHSSLRCTHSIIRLSNIGDIFDQNNSSRIHPDRPPISVIHWQCIDSGQRFSLSKVEKNLWPCSLLVGAPRDHSPHDRIARRGAVWKCEFQSDDHCQRVPFRRDGKATLRWLSISRTTRLSQGEANVRVGTSFDNKTDQWLGASLAANDGNIIVSVHQGYFPENSDSWRRT